MRVMPILLCALLLAAGCVFENEPRGPNANVQRELSPTNKQFGGAGILFAATVVEGGGVRGSRKREPLVVIDVSHEFDKQWMPPGRIALGKQTVTWITGYVDEVREFETPMNGTRIIAFADALESQGRIAVFSNLVYADTEANRAVASAGRPPHRDSWFVLPFFLASLGVAFAAVFLAWFRVKFGVIALAVSIAFWLAYEAITPSFMIRVDLLILFPFLFAAIFSIAAATQYDKKSRR